MGTELFSGDRSAARAPAALKDRSIYVLLLILQWLSRLIKCKIYLHANGKELGLGRSRFTFKGIGIRSGIKGQCDPVNLETVWFGGMFKFNGGYGAGVGSELMPVPRAQE